MSHSSLHVPIYVSSFEVNIFLVVPHLGMVTGQGNKRYSRTGARILSSRQLAMWEDDIYVWRISRHVVKLTIECMKLAWTICSTSNVGESMCEQAVGDKGCQKLLKEVDTCGRDAHYDGHGSNPTPYE